MRFNTTVLFFLTLSASVLLYVGAFKHELSWERIFRDTVSLVTGGLLVSVLSTLGAMKRGRVGAIIGTSIGLIASALLHRFISRYESDFTPFMGVQLMFLILLSAMVNRVLFLDILRNESEQLQLDPENRRRLQAAKQGLRDKLYLGREQCVCANKLHDCSTPLSEPRHAPQPAKQGGLHAACGRTFFYRKWIYNPLAMRCEQCDWAFGQNYDRSRNPSFDLTSCEDETISCLKCGQQVANDADACPQCGWSYEPSKSVTIE
jgi:hypothetical protein